VKAANFAAVNGTSLYYELAGSGTPLVLIHGFSLDRRMWDAQFEQFAMHYQVLRFDMRGFGKSALPAAGEYDRQDDLHALLDTLGIQRAHILGLSLGGAAAIDFALAYPQSTRSLIAVDSVLSGHRWSAEHDASMRPIWALGRSGDLAGARRLWLDHDLFKPANEKPSVAAPLAQIVNDYSGWHWLNRDPLRKPHAAGQLEHIGAPVLSITGERDLPDFHAVADALAQRARARKVVMSGAGHMAPMEDPARFNEIVLDFLAGV
jgi:3-oxoadipate enol-lactonase